MAVPNRRPRRDVPAEAAVEAVPATPPQTASDAAVPVVIPAAAVVAAEAPPAGPPETPEVGSRSDAPRRRLVAAGAAVVVLAAVATAAFVVRTADRSRTEAGRGQPIAVTVPTGSSTHGPAPAPVNPDVVPAGLALYTDPVGFRVGVPAGWNTQREAPTVMFFCEPKGPRTLRVKLWDPTDPDLAVALAKDEAMEKSMLMGYQRIRIDVLPGEAGAEWEYTFDDEMMGGLTHGVDRVVMVAGRSYLLEWRTPPAEWQANLPMYNSIVTSFRPPKLTMMTAS